MSEGPTTEANSSYCGLVTLAGRPNVGKSTLMNALLGQRLSIVSPKPQTTRHRLVGIQTEGDRQIVWVDTPGLHAGKNALNKAMNRTAAASLTGVDLILFVVEADRWGQKDEAALKRIKAADVPVALVINKVDKLAQREKLLAEIETHGARHDYAFIVPLSALKKDNLDGLLQEVLQRLPRGNFLYDEDNLTDRGAGFLTAEAVREQLMLRLGQELPYQLTVETEKVTQHDNGLEVHAVIWVARDSQKAIVIGSKGSNLKTVGTQARKAMSELMGQPVHLHLWVKVKKSWMDSERALRSLGYENGL